MQEALQMCRVQQLLDKQTKSSLVVTSIAKFALACIIYLRFVSASSFPLTAYFNEITQPTVELRVDV
jgi:hypothetical protein